MPMRTTLTTDERLRQERERDFYRAYERLAEEGKCDAAGGREYQRVRQEWKDAGRPDDMDGFIIKRANVSPFDLAAG